MVRYLRSLFLALRPATTVLETPLGLQEVRGRVEALHGMPYRNYPPVWVAITAEGFRIAFRDTTGRHRPRRPGARVAEAHVAPAGSGTAVDVTDIVAPGWVRSVLVYLGIILGALIAFVGHRYGLWVLGQEAHFFLGALALSGWIVPLGSWLQIAGERRRGDLARIVATAVEARVVAEER